MIKLFLLIVIGICKKMILNTLKEIIKKYNIKKIKIFIKNILNTDNPEIILIKEFNNKKEQI